MRKGAIGETADANGEVHWRIRSSDGEGLVWLVWEGKGRKLALNLGPKQEARSALAEWLQATEGEAGGRRGKSPADLWDSI